MDLLMAGAAGIVLAASAWLRAFMPLFGAGLAARFLDWNMASGMDWLSSDAGLVGLGLATLLELAADKVPVVDNVLDAVHTLVGPVAGAVVAFSVWGGFPPAVAMLLALALGAPVASGVHAIAATARLKSTVVSGGVLNPAVSVAEDGISVGAILVALLVPVVALAIALLVMVAIGRFAARRVRTRGHRELPR
jgi:hypothetical protein